MFSALPSFVLGTSLRLVSVGLAAAFAGCAVGPTYQVPAASVPAAYLTTAVEAGWQTAAPNDAVDRGAWWRVFGDAELDRLAERVLVSNQNIAVAVANYAQAQALVREQRASLFPAVSVGAGADRAGAFGSADGAAGGRGSSYRASVGVDWAPDVWGRLSNAVTSASAGAQASEADLASARLSAVGALAINYFSLREADAELALLDQSVEGFARSLEIARNRYAAGIAAQTDVLQAETQWVATQADRIAVQRNRAQFNHAIAVLVGVPPAELDLQPANWVANIPSVPVGVPSTLLERRPDIAAAERSVASANAQVGIARAAYFPSLTLSGSVGGASSRVASLFNASSSLWSLGLSVAQVVFDAGAIGARVDATRAAYDASVARYRQSVLVAFQNVEDQLTALVTLAGQQSLRERASGAADRVEQQVLNRYRAGQVGYTEVVTAQATALNARRALVQLQVNRQIAAVQLAQALGGGWRADWLTSGSTSQTAPE